MTRFIVTAVNSGDLCDGKARVLGAFKTKDEAKNYVDEDIKCWVDDYAELSVVCDFERMNAYFIDTPDVGCEWNIEEIEIDQ